MTLVTTGPAGSAQVIAWAKKWVGYHEGRSGGHWNNHQVFSTDQPGMAWSQDQAWCATFVSDCFHHTIGYAPIGGSPTASVYELLTRARRSGRFTRTPSVGDVMILGSSGEHTGLVYAVDEHFIYTVEGNTNANGSREGDGVYLKRRPRSQPYGYFRPDYAKGTHVVATAQAAPSHVGPVIARGWRRTDAPYRVDVGSVGRLSSVTLNAALAADGHAPDGVKAHTAQQDATVRIVLEALRRVGLVSSDYATRRIAGTTAQHALDTYRDWVGTPRGWSLADRRGTVGKATLDMLFFDAGINATVVG